MGSCFGWKRSWVESPQTDLFYAAFGGGAFAYPLTSDTNGGSKIASVSKAGDAAIGPNVSFTRARIVTSLYRRKK